MWDNVKKQLPHTHSDLILLLAEYPLASRALGPAKCEWPVAETTTKVAVILDLEINAYTITTMTTKTHFFLPS